MGKDNCEEIYKIVNDVDQDGDGQISFKEFKGMMFRLYEGAAG